FQAEDGIRDFHVTGVQTCALPIYTYGAAKEFPAKVNAALSSTAGNAQEVADTVLRIIEIPAGERQLRYFVSPQKFGVDEINALSRRVQANVLEAFGLAADTKFLKGKAVGSV